MRFAWPFAWPFVRGLAVGALAVMCQSGDLVLDSLLTRLVGPLDDDLKALAVLEQAGIEFCLDGA